MAQLDPYKTCLICKAIVELSNPQLGQCSKCFTSQHYDLCDEQMSANLLDLSNSNTVTLHAYGKMVCTLCDCLRSNSDKRYATLCSRSEIRFNAKEVVTAFSHNEKAICNTCYSPDFRPEYSYSCVFRAIVGLTFANVDSSLTVVVITSKWSCTVFKKYYTSGDNHLNCRMLSLPFIMPFAITALTALEVIVMFCFCSPSVIVSLTGFLCTLLC